MHHTKDSGQPTRGMLSGIPEAARVELQVEVVAREAIVDNEVTMHPTVLVEMLRSAEDRAKLRTIPREELYSALLTGLRGEDEGVIRLALEGLAASTWLRMKPAERRLVRASVEAGGGRAWVVIGPLESSIGPWQPRLPTRFARNNWTLNFAEHGHA